MMPDFLICRRPLRCSKLTRQQGFTLIEVMVATAFFMIVLTSIFSLNVSSSGMIQQAKNLDVASLILANLAETMEVLSPARLQDFVSEGQAYTQTGSFTDASASDAFFMASAKEVAAGGQFRQISVQVSWNNPGSQNPHTVSSELLVRLP